VKTIKTLADEIGVTKQAIFQKMKKEPLASGLDNLTTRVGGVVYVYPEGEGMIKEQFHRVQQIFTIPKLDNDIDNFLKQQLDRKDRQLEVLNLHISAKDKQIESLIKQIEELNTALTISQEQTRTAQNLHAGDIHREIIEKLISGQKKPKKNGFWRKKEPKEDTPPAK